METHERIEMRTEQEIQQVFAALQDADPDHDDENCELINDTLRWVVGHDDSPAEEFIKTYIAES
jgi:hypothetical protein